MARKLTYEEYTTECYPFPPISREAYTTLEGMPVLEDEAATPLETPQSLKVLSMPPVDLEGYCDHPDNYLGLPEMERELIGIAVCAARAAAYIGHRTGGGNGDQGHPKAVKAFNKVFAKVRKALGFQTTPPINF